MKSGSRRPGQTLLVSPLNFDNQSDPQECLEIQAVQHLSLPEGLYGDCKAQILAPIKFAAAHEGFNILTCKETKCWFTNIEIQ